MQLSDVKQSDSVIILGFAPSKAIAPIDRPGWDVWPLNELYTEMPRLEARATAWFQLHGNEPPQVRDANHKQFLAKLRCPVLLWKRHPEIPNAVPYPLDEIIAEFGTYFTNSISWMIALAIKLDYKRIHVYGVDMAQNQEYCLAANTRVLTADLRWIPLSDIQVGQELVAFDELCLAQTENEGRYRRWRKATVEAKVALSRPCYRLHLADGTELIASAEHRWLVHACNAHHWQVTEALQPGDVYPQRTSKLVKLLDTWEQDISWGSGYLAAAFDGEGHLSLIPHPRYGETGKRVLLGFAQNANGMRDLVKECLAERGFRYGEHGMNDCLQYTISGGKQEILRFLGMIRPKRLLDKFDPDQLGSVFRGHKYVPIVKSEFLGDQPVIGLKTSTNTFIAEGFASHNSHQRPSCEYFLGWARGRGIELYLPPDSDLLKAWTLYGLEYENPLRAKLVSRHKELEARRAQIQRELQKRNQESAQLNTAFHQLTGALEDCDYMLKLAPVIDTMPAQGVATGKEVPDVLQSAQTPTDSGQQNVLSGRDDAGGGSAQAQSEGNVQPKVVATGGRRGTGKRGRRINSGPTIGGTGTVTTYTAAVVTGVTPGAAAGSTQADPPAQDGQRQALQSQTA